MSNDRIYSEVTQRVMDALEAGTVPWQKPWSARGGAPRNIVSGKPYNGVNVLLLGLQPYSSPYWMTFKQALNKGGAVRKGEHGTRIIYFRIKEVEEENEVTGKMETKKIFFARSYTVFNLEQTDGVPDPDAGKEPAKEFVPIEEAQRLLESIQKDLGMKLKHGGAHAFFQPSSDLVMLPEPETFRSPEAYYSTAFHEAGHWTGHKKRLDRPTLSQATKFGDSNYSKEELVAEMAAGFLVAATGIEVDFLGTNRAAYIANWLKALEGDKRLVVSAASKAQKAADYLLQA